MSTKLLVYTENYVFGGGNRYMVDLINGLAPFFDRIDLVANPGGLFDEDLKRLDPKAVWVKVPVYNRLWLSQKLSSLPAIVRQIILKALKFLDPFFFFLNAWRYGRLLKRLEPQVVLSCNGGYPAAHSTLAMIRAAGFRHIPGVLSVVSMPTTRSLTLYFFDRYVDQAIAQGVKRIIVNAAAIKKALKVQHDLPEETTRIVHNGLDEAEYLPRETRDSKKLVFGFVSRLDIQKGILPLLEAFEKIAPAHPEAVLALHGIMGDAEQEIKTLMETSPHRQRIELHGYYRDVSQVMRAIDIFVYPSLWDGLPYTVMEAMRAGLPIIATRVGGIPEIVTDQQDGLLVAPGSSDQLAEAMIKVLSEPTWRRSLGTQARERFKRELTLKSMHVNVVKVFAEAGLLPNLSETTGSRPTGTFSVVCPGGKLGVQSPETT